MQPESPMIVGDAMIHSPKTAAVDITVAQARAFFGNDHVHALLVVGEGRLVTVVERQDLSGAPDGAFAGLLGRLSDRIIDPGARLHDTWGVMRAAGRRRLAVVGNDGRLLGLLCLKRSGAGFCSDEGLRARAIEGARSSRPTVDLLIDKIQNHGESGRLRGARR